MGKKILIVDDDLSILDALELTLESNGFDVKTTDKGEEIYENIRKYKPDLILLDVLMSGTDGREICKEIKSNSYKHIPVIMISAHPGAEQSSQEVGADEFLAKPFEVVDLLNKVNKQLSKKNKSKN